MDEVAYLRVIYMADNSKQEVLSGNYIIGPWKWLND
jgi:hypothetical protein